jgi:hypothetical protein
MRAPWEVTTLVASLPVLVLGLGTALPHTRHRQVHEWRLQRARSCPGTPFVPCPPQAPGPKPQPLDAERTEVPHRSRTGIH